MGTTFKGFKLPIEEKEKREKKLIITINNFYLMKLLKSILKIYLDGTKKNCFWLTTGNTYVPWMTGKE